MISALRFGLGLRAAAPAAAVVLMATGCSSPAPETIPGIEMGPYEITPADLSPAQAAAISDGVVTQAEYDDGFTRYKECLATAGFPMIDNGMVNGRHDFLVPTDATDAGVEPGCYITEYTAVDWTWQIVSAPSGVG